MAKFQHLRTMLLTATCAVALFLPPAASHATGTNCSGLGSTTLCNTTNGSGMTVNWVAAKVDIPACTPAGWYSIRHTIHGSNGAAWTSQVYKFYHNPQRGECSRLVVKSYYLPQFTVNKTFDRQYNRSCVWLYNNATGSGVPIGSSCNGVKP